MRNQQSVSSVLLGIPSAQHALGTPFNPGPEVFSPLTTRIRVVREQPIGPPADILLRISAADLASSQALEPAEVDLAELLEAVNRLVAADNLSTLMCSLKRT